MAIARKGMRRIVVDDVEYHWRSASDWAYDRSPSVMIVEGGAERRAKGEGAPRVIRFAIPWRGDPTRPGWWIDTRVSITPVHVARAIKIANRGGVNTLTTDDVIELLDLDRPRPEDRLRDLEAALAKLPGARVELVAALLALGCHDDRGELIDDWFACHADRLIAARPELQNIANTQWYSSENLRVRSALAFLDDFRRRVGIDLAIDTTVLDGRLATFDERAPWGIPSSHHWWKSL